jgi:hypothetical protein
MSTQDLIHDIEEVLEKYKSDEPWEDPLAQAHRRLAENRKMLDDDNRRIINRCSESMILDKDLWGGDYWRGDQGRIVIYQEDFVGWGLSGRMFQSITFVRCLFDRSNLSGSSFKECRFEKCSFTGANTLDANWSGSFIHDFGGLLRNPFPGSRNFTILPLSGTGVGILIVAAIFLFWVVYSIFGGPA